MKSLVSLGLGLFLVLWNDEELICFCIYWRFNI